MQTKVVHKISCNKFNNWYIARCCENKFIGIERNFNQIDCTVSKIIGLNSLILIFDDNNFRIYDLNKKTNLITLQLIDCPTKYYVLDETRILFRILHNLEYSEQNHLFFQNKRFKISYAICNLQNGTYDKLFEDDVFKNEVCRVDDKWIFEGYNNSYITTDFINFSIIKCGSIRCVCNIHNDIVIVKKRYDDKTNDKYDNYYNIKTRNFVGEGLFISTIDNFIVEYSEEDKCIIMKEIIKELNVIEDQNDICKICYEHLTKRIAIIPCGHTCICKKCSELINVCPICRTEKAGTVELFL